MSFYGGIIHEKIKPDFFSFHFAGRPVPAHLPSGHSPESHPADTGELTGLSDEDRKTLLETYHLTKVIDVRSHRDVLHASADPELPGVTNCRYPFSSVKNYYLTPPCSGAPPITWKP